MISPRRPCILAGWPSAAILFCLITSHSVAQTIDYGGLSNLFGESVTTSATGLPQRESDVPVAMDIITAEEIRRSGLRDIPAIVARYAGLDIVHYTDGQMEVGVRSSALPMMPQLLVLVNGRQVYIDTYGLTTWPGVPVEIEEIRQIEVVKGPNTALFGFNAFSGVINIVTYSPLYDHRSGGSVTVGSPPSFNGSASVTAREGNIGVRASAGIDRSDGYDDRLPDDVGELEQGNPDPEASRAAFAVMAEIAPAIHVEAEVTASAMKRNEITGGVTFSQSTYDQRSLRAAVTTDHQKLGVWRFEAYHNKNDGDLLTDLGELVPTSINNDLSVASIKGLIKPLPSHTGRLQLEYRDTRSKATSGATPTGSGGADIYAVGGAWHWQTTDWLAITVAGRLDHYATFLNSEPRGFPADAYDRTLTEPSFNLGSVAKWGAKDSIRLAIGRGVLLPNHVDLFYSAQVGPNPFGITAVSGDPRIDPTKNLSAEIGWNHRFDAAEAAFDASLFWQRQTDLKSVAPRFSDPNLVVFGSEILNLPRNVGDTTIIGGEFALEGKLSEVWNYRLGYMLLSVDDDLDVNQSSLAYAVDFEDSTPTHTVDVGLGYEAGPIEGDLALRWQSSRTFLTPNTDPVTFAMETEDVDNVLDLTGRLGYRLSDHVDLSLIGTNILGGADWGPAVDIDSRILLSLRWAFQ